MGEKVTGGRLRGRFIDPMRFKKQRKFCANCLPIKTPNHPPSSLPCARSTNSAHSRRPTRSGSSATPTRPFAFRSEEHTSELQSRFDLVCRLLLENKNI